MQIETIREQLKLLRLPTASEGFESVLAERRIKSDFSWLSTLLELELNARKENALERRIKKATFPERRCLEQFNWDFNKKIDREKIEELATCRFVEKNEIALFLGSPGTGKTHCAIAIGMRAAQLGHSIFCSSVKRLSSRIRIARERNTLDQLFKQILVAKLWILDDWGVVTMPRDVSEEVFDLFDRRKANSAMILTSNRDVEEWPQVFSDPILANAAIDRMFEQAKIVIFEGPSYRMKGRIIMQDVDIEKHQE
ncbi:MAG: IS21-like element helper ATPase IstB [Pseudobdellovibrionaceae bacterium]|jgi:DNA replication protein DnaC